MFYKNVQLVELSEIAHHIDVTRVDPEELWAPKCSPVLKIGKNLKGHISSSCLNSQGRVWVEQASDCTE